MRAAARPRRGTSNVSVRPHGNITSTENRRVSADRCLRWSALLVFVAFAITFHYFFADDEAITFVDARHLLDGQGLTDSASERAAEGYGNLSEPFHGGSPAHMRSNGHN